MWLENSLECRSWGWLHSAWNAGPVVFSQEWYSHIAFVFMLNPSSFYLSTRDAPCLHTRLLFLLLFHIQLLKFFVHYVYSLWPFSFQSPLPNVLYSIIFFTLIEIIMHLVCQCTSLPSQPLCWASIKIVTHANQCLKSKYHVLWMDSDSLISKFNFPVRF